MNTPLTPTPEMIEAGAQRFDDEIDEAIGKLLSSMSKQDRLVCEAMTQLNVYGHVSKETLLDSLAVIESNRGE